MGGSEHKVGVTLIGRTALISVTSTMKMRVKIIDTRVVYGRVEYCVEPVEGTGSGWVATKRLEFASRE